MTEGNEIAYASAIKSFPNNSNFDSGKDFIIKIAYDLLAFGQCTAFLGCFRLFGMADDGYVQQFVGTLDASSYMLLCYVLTIFFL